MKYIPTTLASLVLLLANSSQGFAEESKGTQKEILDSLQENGSMTIEGIIIKDTLDLNGSLWAHVAHTGKLNVGDHAFLRKFTLEKDYQTNSLA